MVSGLVLGRGVWVLGFSMRLRGYRMLYGFSLFWGFVQAFRVQSLGVLLCRFLGLV